MDPIRKECEQKPDAVVMFEKLEECNTRVSAKTETEETCAQELYDYIHHVDHCVSSFFSLTNCWSHKVTQMGYIL